MHPIDFIARSLSQSLQFFQISYHYNNGRFFVLQTKKKNKKSGKKSQHKDGPLVSAQQYEEACKNIKAVAKSIGASKHEKSKTKKRKNSESIATNDSPPKKSKKPKPTIQSTENIASKKSENKKKPADKQLNEKKKKVVDKQSDEKKKKVSSNEKSILSKSKKAVIVKKGCKDAHKDGEKTLTTETKETKSQRKRKKLKLKKLAKSSTLGDAMANSILAGKSADPSPAKSLNVQRIEKLLALKEKRVNGKKNIVKEPETLRERMMAQLRASRFRFLNETLYNNESSESKKYFKEDPDAFTAYHNGYRQQVEQWPVNPLDVVISAIKKMFVTI